MLLIWGSKKVHKKLGRGGCWCPICADLTSFRITGVGTVGHLYYIPLGRGKILVHELKCDHCATVLGEDATARTWFATSALDAYRESGDVSVPGISREARQRWVDRREVEDPDASSEDRADALLQPLIALEYMAIEKKESSTSESITALLALALIVLVIVDAVLLLGGGGPPSINNPNPGPPVLATTISLILTTLVLGLLIWRGITGRKRIGEKVVLSRLARSYATLMPTQDEIELVLAIARESKLQSSRTLTADRVLGALGEQIEVAP